MTLDLEAIKKRLDKATPGPWEYRFYSACMFPHHIMQIKPNGYTYNVWGHHGQENKNNGELIAHAPTDLRALIKSNEDMAAEISRLKRSRKKLAVHRKKLKRY